MKKFFKFIPLIALILGLVIVPVRARGLDFGDFSGDSDFGGGWDSGDSWDSGGSDWGSSWDDDDDYSCSGGHYSGSSSDGDWIFILIFLVLIIGPALLKSGKKSNNRPVNTPYIQPTPTASLKSVASYSGVDPTFSPTEFKEKQESKV